MKVGIKQSDTFIITQPPLYLPQSLRCAIDIDFRHAWIYTSVWHVCVHAGAILAVQGGVDENGFYLGSFEGKTGLVPANFVQEMEVEDSQQRKRLLNQTLSRPHLTSFTSPCTSLSSSRPTSASILSPSGTYSPFLHSTGNCNVSVRNVHLCMYHITPHSTSKPFIYMYDMTDTFISPTVPPPPDPPTSVTVESTREKRIVMVSWTPPSLGSKITGYEVYVDKHVKATVTASQNKVSGQESHHMSHNIM